MNQHPDPDRLCGIEICDRPHRRNGLCDLHDARMKRTGTTDAPHKPTFTERFWSKVDQRGPGECWPWSGPTNNHGYGRFASYEGNDRKRHLAHRLAYELTTGRSIEGQVIRHSCDNPPCCNPAHLTPGTQAQNVADAMARGRSISPPHLLGENVPSSRLTETAVREIRQRYAAGGVTQTDLAQEFGVSQTIVSDVVTGKRWRHVEDQGGLTPAERAAMDKAAGRTASAQAGAA